MAEVTRKETVERTFAFICDVCDKRMIPYDEPYGKIIFDHPEDEWKENHLCPGCYGEVMDYVFVDMKKARRNA